MIGSFLAKLQACSKNLRNRRILYQSQRFLDMPDDLDNRDATQFY